MELDLELVILPNFQQLPNVRQKWKQDPKKFQFPGWTMWRAGKWGEVRVTVDRLLRLTCKQREVFIVHSQLVEF